MVRLQQLSSAAQRWRALVFQSHYGAIATWEISEDVINRVLLFQSHYGAIATVVDTGARPCAPCFQSHYGAIATPSP